MELYKTLYISVTLHIIVLSLIGGVIMYNDPALLIPDKESPIINSRLRTSGTGFGDRFKGQVNEDGIIIAKIITEPESKDIKTYNKKVRMKVKSPTVKISNIYDNVTVENLGKHPVIQISEQTNRYSDNTDSYLENSIKVEPQEIVRNKISVIGSVSFYGNENIGKIRDSIEKAKTYPILARKKGIEGEVTVRFRITANGMVDDVKIVKSSGFEILDKESIETIKRSVPLPYIDRWIEISLIFRLDL